MKSLLRTATLLIVMLGTSLSASAQTPRQDAVTMSKMPVLVLSCEHDPGGINPGGGRGMPPDELEERWGCRPAEGVALTFRSERFDWFTRCDTDKNGECEVTTPAGPPPEYELAATVHLATVDPGYAPNELTSTTANYTEFAGYGVVLLPVDDATPTPGAERPTLAVSIAECEDGSTAGCERAPVEALVRASTGVVTAKGAPWLATNDAGWVSFDRASLGGDTIDVMLKTDTEPRFACTVLDSGDRLDTEWIEGRERNFIRVAPVSEGTITCDVTLLDA